MRRMCDGGALGGGAGILPTNYWPLQSAAATVLSPPTRPDLHLTGLNSQVTGKVSDSVPNVGNDVTRRIVAKCSHMASG